MKKFLLATVLLVVSHMVLGEEAQRPDLPTRYGRYYSSFHINDDGTSTETREWSMTVLKDSALDWAKKASVSYSTSVQKAEVVSAYTLKPDGRRIDVPKDNYQININQGNSKDAPVFSDYSTLSVVFPDVAVGDTLVFSYRITQSEAIFPKHFSIAETFSKQSEIDDVRVSIDYPAALWVQYESRGMKEKLSEKEGCKHIEWSLANPIAVKSERRDYSVYEPEKEIGYAFSSFKNYAEIAAAYAERALPKAIPNERVKALAAEIVAARTGQKEQARLLYEWVAKNITYAGNCVGVGAVVPHDLSFIIDNKMGDCKDHATLLQALLASRGIESYQVLINAGSVFNLPKIPVVSMVNHVLNYLPALNLYLDSTSSSTPFGMLPVQDRGKPVLWVGHYKDGTKTPVPELSSAQRTINHFKIGDDGSLSGSAEVFMEGDLAVTTREWMRTLDKDTEKDFVKNMFRSMGLIGTGKLIKDDPKELESKYHYKIIIDKIEKAYKVPGSGAFYLFPLTAGGASMFSMMATGAEIEKEADIMCSNAKMIEEYKVELPKNMKVLAIPEKQKINSSQHSYIASYALKKNILTARREIDDRTPGIVCGPKSMQEFHDFSVQVIDNLKSQVLYK